MNPWRVLILFGLTVVATLLGVSGQHGYASAVATCTMLLFLMEMFEDA